ncbi:MAG TPA: SCO family protein [Caulobacteraceae bacterium]
MSPRRLILLVLILLGLGLAGTLAWQAYRPAPPPQPSLVGGPFQLVDQNGRPTDESVLKGKWSAVFFGFTYCPDVCPGTLQALAAAKAQLGGKARNFQVVFISVDPERDTPRQMKAYLEAQGLPDAIGLTGTVEQVDAAAKAYRVSHQKEGSGEGYTVSHSAAVFLMDPQGRFVKPLSYGMTPDEMAGQIAAAM